MRAFLWKSNQGMQALPALPGGRFSTASAISESGEIVGSAESSLGGIRAVLWSPSGEPQDLNTLVSVPPGLVLREAVGINERGQIVVLGRDQKDIHANHEGAKSCVPLDAWRTLRVVQKSGLASLRTCLKGQIDDWLISLSSFIKEQGGSRHEPIRHL